MLGYYSADTNINPVVVLVRNMVPTPPPIGIIPPLRSATEENDGPLPYSWIPSLAVSQSVSRSVMNSSVVSCLPGAELRRCSSPDDSFTQETRQVSNRRRWRPSPRRRMLISTVRVSQYTLSSYVRLCIPQSVHPHPARFL